MDNHHRTVVSSTHMHIHTKACPCGNVYLYVGHTCIYLRQEEFLDLAQIVQAVEHFMREQPSLSTDGHRH